MGRPEEPRAIQRNEAQRNVWACSGRRSEMRDNRCKTSLRALTRALRGFPERCSWCVNAAQQRSLLCCSCHTLHGFGIAQASRLILWIKNRCRVVDDANIQLIVAIKINMARQFTVKETECARWYWTSTRCAINR